MKENRSIKTSNIAGIEINYGNFYQNL